MLFSTSTQRLDACRLCAERTVALLAFEDARDSPVGDLMDLAQRHKTASELNAAILSSQSQAGLTSTASHAAYRHLLCMWLLLPCHAAHASYNVNCCFTLLCSWMQYLMAWTLPLHLPPVITNNTALPSCSTAEHTATVRIQLIQVAAMQEQEPRLPMLLKMLIWAHNQLDEKLIYPHITDLATAELGDMAEVAC